MTRLLSALIGIPLLILWSIGWLLTVGVYNKVTTGKVWV